MRKLWMVVRQNQFTGKTNKLEIEFDLNDYNRWQHEGGCIQDYLGYLPPAHREFLMTGVTPEEWDEMMKDKE